MIYKLVYTKKKMAVKTDIDINIEENFCNQFFCKLTLNLRRDCNLAYLCKSFKNTENIISELINKDQD